MTVLEGEKKPAEAAAETEVPPPRFPVVMSRDPTANPMGLRGDDRVSSACDHTGGAFVRRGRRAGSRRTAAGDARPAGDRCERG